MEDLQRQIDQLKADVGELEPAESSESGASAADVAALTLALDDALAEVERK